MLKKNYRFESEVHLGLLAIVFLLLVINFSSNVILYRMRSMSREEALARLRNAAVAISRTVQANYPRELSGSETEELRAQYGLSGLGLVPSRPPDQSVEARRRWFTSIVEALPPGQVPDFAEKLLKSEYGKITRGADGRYFYVYAIPGGAGKNLVIVSSENPTLAFLDGSTVLVMTVGLVGLFVLSIVYLWLSRFIFSPFRKIREFARQAGRMAGHAESDVDVVVAEYESIIHELKENERKLLELNEKISDRANSIERFNEYLLSSMNSGVVTLDRSGTVVMLNAAAARILNIAPETSRAENYRQLFNGASELQKRVEQALENHDVAGYREYTCQGADEAEITLGVTLSVIVNERQEAVGVSILLNDLTELSRLRAELETQRRLAAMGEMAGGLAHQLRNSLGAIMGYGRLVKRKLTNAGQPAVTADSLLQETAEAERMIHQFLDFTRPLTYSPAPVELEAFVNDLVGSFAVRSQFARISFRAEVQSDAWITIDALLLKQALANIIDNAIQAYASGEGIVKIRASVETGQIVFNVEDFGCGIPAEYRDRIFMPFFSRRPSGTGLGLSLAGKIIDLHGGRIHVASEEGQGTTFTIELPLVFSEGAEHPVAPAAARAR